MARCRLRRVAEAYSPECVEEDFCELRNNGVLRSSAERVITLLPRKA
jgi:hypothetical protein